MKEEQISGIDIHDRNSVLTCLNNLTAYVWFWISTLYTSNISPSPIRKSLWKCLVPSMILWKLMEGLCSTPWEEEKTETMSHLSEESTSLLQAGHTHWKQIIRAEGMRESKSQEATVKPTRVLWPFAWAWLSFLNTVWGFSHIWKATWLLSSQRLTKELSLGLDSKNLSSGRCLGFDLLVLTSWTLRMTQQCPPSIANREAFH